TPSPLALTAATATAATAAATAAPLLLLLLRLLILLLSLSQPLLPRTPTSLPAVTSLRRSGGSGDGGGGSSGSGGSCPSSRCGAVRWGQLREWYTSKGGGGGRIGGRSVAVQLGVTGGGLPQLQRRLRETLSPQQFREWYVQHGASQGSARCSYVIRTEFGDATELPRWLKLVRQGVDFFALHYDAILTAMYNLSATAEGDCSQCVPPDPDIAAAALGASEPGTLSGTAPTQALHTFTLDSGASRCFFCDSTTLTPLPAPVPVRLVDPSGGPIVARSSTVLLCPAVPSSSLSGLHLPSFSTNLTLLWHHRLGHPSLPCLHGMHSHLLVSGLPRSLPPLLPSPTPPCLPCIEGRQHAAPHSSSFPPTTTPLQTLHMDVWGPARISGQGPRAPLSAVRLQLRERFGQDLHCLRLHSDRGGEFSSNLSWEICRGEGVLQSFTLPNSPQQNGIAERRIGLVMEVRGSRAFVCNTSADKLSARAIPCVFLGFVPNTPGWQFYHPTSRCVFPSRDITIDESVPFYCLFPYRSAPPPPPPLFLAPGPPPVDPLTPQGPAPSGVSQVDPLPGTALVLVAVGSGAAPGAAPGGAASGGAEPGGAESEGAGSGGAEPRGEEPGGAEPAGVETGGVEPGGAEFAGAGSRDAEPRGDASSRGAAGASPRLSPQQLREWFVWGTGAAGTGGVGGAGAGDPAEPVGDGAGGTGAGGTGAGGAGAARAGAVDPGAGGPRGTMRPRPYFVPLLQQVLGVPSSTGLTPPLLCPLPDQSQLPLQPASPLLAPSPYTEQSGGLIEHREPASRPVCPVHTARRVPRSCPPRVPSTHAMTLRPPSVPLHVPLPPPPESSLPEVPDSESDRARAASPTVARLLATFVTDHSFESAAASALVVDLLEFVAACRLDYATALVAESASASPSSIGDIPTPRSYAEAITGPYSSHWQAAMDAEMTSWTSTGTYVDEIPPPGANIVDGMWIFKVKRPPGSPLAFKARYVGRGFSQQQGVDYFQTFSPTTKMTTLRVLLLHEEIWLRRPPGFTESFSAGTQWSLRRPVYGLRQARREWHDTLTTTLAAHGFAPATADPSLIDTLVLTWVLQRFGFQFSSPQPSPLSTSHSLSALPSDESIEPSDPYPELVGCLMYLMICTRPDLAYLVSLLARYVAPVPRAWGLCLEDGVHLSSLVTQTLVGSTCEAEIYARAIAAQELCWLTYLLTDLGEQPRLPPVLYVDNKAMIALCQEHRLELRTKHVALRYFLARELQQRGQLRLAYVATRANTADIFTKALPPGDHQRFSTVLGLVPTLPHLLTA
ncbi:unnamed protein product, partial [Closterium sp. NIES-53]